MSELKRKKGQVTHIKPRKGYPIVYDPVVFDNDDDLIRFIGDTYRETARQLARTLVEQGGYSHLFIPSKDLPESVFNLTEKDDSAYMKVKLPIARFPDLAKLKEASDLLMEVVTGTGEIVCGWQVSDVQLDLDLMERCKSNPNEFEITDEEVYQFLTSEMFNVTFCEMNPVPPAKLHKITRKPE